MNVPVLVPVDVDVQVIVLLPFHVPVLGPVDVDVHVIVLLPVHITVLVPVDVDVDVIVILPIHVFSLDLTLTLAMTLFFFSQMKKHFKMSIKTMEVVTYWVFHEKGTSAICVH